jgi:hypothetical protein
MKAKWVRCYLRTPWDLPSLQTSMLNPLLILPEFGVHIFQNSINSLQSLWEIIGTQRNANQNEWLESAILRKNSTVRKMAQFFSQCAVCVLVQIIVSLWRRGIFSLPHLISEWRYHHGGLPKKTLSLCKYLNLIKMQLHESCRIHPNFIAEDVGIEIQNPWSWRVP